jgi:hypothetical protein
MTDQRAPLASVDEVREELRRLGYLQSGLERFVLGGAATATPTRASWRAAWRVGVIGGALVGLCLALGAAAVDPRLLRAPQDLVVLAVYLALASAAVTAAVAFLAGLAAHAYARRGRAASAWLSRNIGLVVGLAALLYLTLWWRSHLVHRSPLLMAGAVLLGLCLSLVLGRFGALSAVAVLSAAGAGARVPTASLARRRLLPLLAAGALLFGGGVAVASYLGGRAPAAPDFAVVPTGLRVRVLAVDGLDPRLAEEMAQAGEMPNLSALLSSAARFRLRLEPEMVPAIVWTTVATGRGPEAHGVQSAGARRLPGMRTSVPLSDQGRFARALARAGETLRLTRVQPASSVLRGVKTFWNVASEKGLRVGVVNWWATRPADPVNGYLVSDRAFFKVEKGAAPEQESYPADVLPRLRARLDAVAEEDRARRLDAFHLQASLDLRRESPPDVEAVYLPGLDIVTMQQLGETAAVDVAALDGRLGVVRAHYRFLDGLLGDLRATLVPGEVLALVGDPGRLPRAAGHPTEGLLALVGAPARAGDFGVAAERDVCPTVLRLAGLPVSRELEGRALDEFLEAGFRQRHPVRWVERYGRRPEARPAESGFDREMVEQLRSLGYIQ